MDELIIVFSKQIKAGKERFSLIYCFAELLTVVKRCN